jgi:hypothetical protein
MNTKRVLAMAGVSLLTVPTLAAEGDVLVFLDAAGTLVVEGDTLANEILVGRTGSNGEFIVTGLGTTTVNGTTQVILVADSVRIAMRRGNDRVRVDGNIPGDVLVDGGPGDDQLDLGDPSIAGAATLIGGSGNDRFGIEGTLVRQALWIRGGPGDDIVDLFFATALQELVIETSDGNDVVHLRRVGSGSLSVVTGHHSDQVSIEDVDVAGDARIASGTSGDVVTLGPGFVVGGALDVALSSGDDLLEIEGTEVTGPVVLNGGLGADFLDDGGGNVFLDGPPTIKNF